MIYWVVRRVDMVDMADGELLCKDGAACILFAGKRINEPQLDHQRLKLRFEATVFARGMVSIDSW